MSHHGIDQRREAASSFRAAGLLLVVLAVSMGAGPPSVKGRRVSLSHQPGVTVTTSPTSPTAPATVEETPTIDVLKGMKSGQLSVTAEGTGDGRMTLSLTNRTHSKLRVVLPPGLIASGATGQFGGGMGGMGGGMGGMGGGMMGGMGGMGGGMGGMGGGMGGMGGGMGGMGGGMGGRGGMSGGGMSGGTMPASMGMMMLGRLIMSLIGDRDSWDQMSLMSGMMMGMGGGMGGRGGMMGGMGGMGGGFRSVPPTGLLETTLKPRQVRHLPTPVVSLNGPNEEARPLVPAKGERLRILGIDEATDDARTRVALKRLAEAKAPRTVAQMVLWYVTAGADWDSVGRLSQGWGNAHEIALARQFVADLDMSPGQSTRSQNDPGVLYWDIKAEGDRARQLADGLRVLWAKYPVLGLSAKEGVPASPNGPALACHLEVTDAGTVVKLSASHPSGSDWVGLGEVSVKPAEPATVPEDSATETTTGLSARDRDAARIGDAVAEGMLTRLVLVRLSHGPRIDGKPTYKIKIVNNSPMILNGLALGGTEVTEDNPPSVLSGLSLPPLKSLTVPGSAEMVGRLHLKDSMRVLGADLSAL